MSQGALSSLVAIRRCAGRARANVQTTKAPVNASRMGFEFSLWKKLDDPLLEDVPTPEKIRMKTSDAIHKANTRYSFTTRTLLITIGDNEATYHGFMTLLATVFT